MTWVKLDDRTFTNRKIQELSKDAKLLYLSGLCHCAANLTDGMLTPAAVRVVQATVGADDEAVYDLVAASLWENTKGGFMVHDYLEYNPSRAQVMALRDKRADAGRAGGVAKAVAFAKQVASGLPDESLYPDPSPSPPIPKPNPVPAPEDGRLALLAAYRAERWPGKTLFTRSDWGEFRLQLSELLADGRTPEEVGIATRAAMGRFAAVHMVNLRSVARHFESLLEPVTESKSSRNGRKQQTNTDEAKRAEEFIARMAGEPIGEDDGR